MAVSKISRRVYFFRVANSSEFVDYLENAVDFIDTLPFDDQGRYQPTLEEDTVLAVFVKQSSYPIMLQFARIRRDNLPLVERAGSITPLALDSESGLMDWSHIVIFADGIVAAEFNQEAPRINRLGQYLFFKSHGILSSSPKFLPLFQKNVLDMLDRLDGVTILELEARTDDAHLIAEADKSIAAAFEACRAAGQVSRASITLKSSRSPTMTLSRLARKLITNTVSRESLLKLKVTGGSGADRRPIDLLEEYLVSTESFVRLDPRFKAVSTEDAFRVLQRSYHSNLSRFADAVTGTGLW